MNLRMDRIIDLVMEHDNAFADYRKKSADYFKKHGHGVYLAPERAMTKEEAEIAYDSENCEATHRAIHEFLYILDFDPDQTRRLHTAARAMKRWYNKETDWQKVPTDELINRIERFVIG